MDADIVQDASAPIEDSSDDIAQEELNNVDSLEAISSGGNMLQELEDVREILTRVELDIACTSEKLLNLNVLLMYVETRESDLEAFGVEGENESSDMVEKVLEFDFLSGFLDSEAKELDHTSLNFETEITHAREILADCEHLGETFKEMEEKLHDSEESLKQLLEQVSDLRVQSSNFQNVFLRFNEDENWRDHKRVEFLESDAFLNSSPKIGMQTAEQKRHFLRMLEKSLARELELEKKVSESRQVEENLRLRLHQEVFCVDEEAMVTLGKRFEAENSSEVFMGVSKELLARLQIVQFYFNGLNQRQGELTLQLQDSNDLLKAKDIALKQLEGTNEGLREKTNSLEKQLKNYEVELQSAKVSVNKEKDLQSKVLELENVIEELKEQVSEADKRTLNAEARCKSLTEISNSKEEDVALLERQLMEAEFKLQHAVASAEASQERQTMLCSMISDMENLIEGLKSRVSKAESQTKSAEEKCIVLSESNADLTEELNFVRDKMENLEASLRQAEETKNATAKDISISTKLISGLVVQLALERERLCKQISTLRSDNKALERCLQQIDKDSSMTKWHDVRGNSKEIIACSHEFVTVTDGKDSAELAANFSASSSVDQQPQLPSTSENEMFVNGTKSEIDTVRNIDARQLSLKHVGVAIMILVAVAAFLLQRKDSQF